MLQPLKSESWVGLCPVLVLAVLEFSCDTLGNACVSPLASAGLPPRELFPNGLSNLAV